MAAPTESKVWGATVGGTAGYTISQFILWLLGVTLWGTSADALSATEAVTAVPEPVNGIVGLGITIAGVFLGGWLAKHTPRVLEELENYGYEEPVADEIQSVEFVEPTTAAPTVVADPEEDQDVTV